MKYFITLLFSFSLFSSVVKRVELQNIKNQTYMVVDHLFYLVKLPTQFQYTLKSLVRPNTIYELKGEFKNGNFLAEKTPTIFADYTSLEGYFSYDNETKKYYIDGLEIKFGLSKEVYGHKFDNQSKQSFVGHNVFAQGHTVNKDNHFEVNAIVFKDLLVATLPNELPPREEHVEFWDHPFKYVKYLMPKNSHSQSKRPFRGTIFESKKNPVTPGDHFLVLTLSGRQGDSMGAAAGHFVPGMGIVDHSMRLKGEVFNFYFYGEKEILAGNTDLVSYFGHIFKGQNNYRPVYTLIIYGPKESELKKIRDLFELENFKVRSDDKLRITQFYNCTTVSNDHLGEIDFNGNHKRFFKQVFDIQNLGLLNPFFYFSKPLYEAGATILGGVGHLMATDFEKFMPRRAFESFYKMLFRKSFRIKHNIKRVDYIFMPQTPSSRPVGGIPYNDFFEAQKIIGAFTKQKSGKVYTQQEVDELLLSID